MLDDELSVKTAAATAEDADDQLVVVVVGADHFSDPSRRRSALTSNRTPSSLGLHYQSMMSLAMCYSAEEAPTRTNWKSSMLMRVDSMYFGTERSLDSEPRLPNLIRLEGKLNCSKKKRKKRWLWSLK